MTITFYDCFVDASDPEINSKAVRLIVFGNHHLENLLQNYLESENEAIYFPLIKHPSDSYLKYLEVFPFWKQDNPYVRDEISRFLKRFQSLKSNQTVVFRFDSKQELTLDLQQVQTFLPSIFEFIKEKKLDEHSIVRIHLRNVSFHCFSLLVSIISNPKYMIQKWTISLTDFLAQFEFFLSIDSIELADFWYRCFVYMIPTLPGKLWLKKRLSRQFKLYTQIGQLRKCLIFKFEQFILDPLFLNISFEEMKSWLREKMIGVSEEMILYLAALKWLNFNWINRKHFASQILMLIQFSLMSPNQVVSCFFPPILSETSRITCIRANLDLALYNVQMRIKLISNNRRTYLRSESSSSKPLKVWIKNVNQSLHQISRENESKVYGIPIEFDNSIQNERSELKQLKTKNQKFQLKLEASITSDFNASETQNRLTMDTADQLKKVSSTTQLAAASMSLTPLHVLRRKANAFQDQEIKRSSLKWRYSHRSIKLPIDFFDWNTCSCLYGLHDKDEKCSFGFGMNSSLSTFSGQIGLSCLDFNWQKANCFKLFSIVKRPHRYTFAFALQYFDKTLHLKRIELSVEYMSLILMGSPLTGFGYGYLWRIDLSRNVYAPVNWYIFAQLPVVERRIKSLVWFVDSPAIDFHGELFVVGGRRYSEEQSILMLMDQASLSRHRETVVTSNMQTKSVNENEIKMAALIHSPISSEYDQIVYVDNPTEVVPATSLEISAQSYLYTPSRKQLCEVESMLYKRTNHSLVKCTIDHEERVLAIGGENKSNKLLDSIEMFDGKKWLEWNTLPHALCGASCVFIPFYINKYFIENHYFNTLWVMGGWQNDSISNKLSRNRRLLSNSIFWLNVKEKKWVRYSIDLPKPIAFASAAFHNECIYLVGGVHEHSLANINLDVRPTDECWVLDLNLNKWIQVFSLLQPRSRVSLLSIGNRLLAVGGDDANGWPTRYVEMLMNNGLGWCQEVDCPVAISGQQLIAFKMHDLPEPSQMNFEFAIDWQWRPDAHDRLVTEAEHLAQKKPATSE